MHPRIHLRAPTLSTLSLSQNISVQAHTARGLGGRRGKEEEEDGQKWMIKHAT
jgi:hypothetical protein